MTILRRAICAVSVAIVTLSAAPEIRAATAAALNPVDYGAKCDATLGELGSGTDDSAALQAWITAVITTAGWGVMPGSTCRSSRSLSFDFAPVNLRGATFEGAGIGRSIIQFDAGFSASIFSSGGMVSPNVQRPTMFPKFVGLGFWGSSDTGPILRIGASDGSDIPQAGEFDIAVGNISMNWQAAGIEIFGLLGSRVKVVSNTGGPGTAIIAHYTAFNSIMPSVGPPGGSGIHFTRGPGIGGGFNYGNVIEAMDCENVAYCVILDSPGDIDNLFLGGQWSWSAFGIRGVMGSGNRALTPHPSPLPGAGALIAPSVGVTVLP
jgi:hypothetical protein